jgi:hypothetical protein
LSSSHITRRRQNSAPSRRQALTVYLVQLSTPSWRLHRPLELWNLPRENIPIHPIQPPGQYIAIRPDDMLSVQESHMASKGMDTYSVCPACRIKGLHVLNTSAVLQKFGNSYRAIRFFCEQCQTVCDEPALGPLPPCPIPKQVLAEMRKFPVGTPPQISRPTDFETFEECVRKQPSNKAPGGDAMPRELGKYGPTALVELYWRAGNEYRRGEAPTVCPLEWAGAVAGYIPNNLSALLMSEFRPIACICTNFVYVLSVQIQRLTRNMEDYKLIDDAQEAFRRGRMTKRQLGKLYSILAEQRRRKADRQTNSFIENSIEAGILLCGNGVSCHGGCTRA